MDVKVQEIQSLSVEEVAASKALAAFAQTGRPVVVDDTGMSIEALNGLPGALVSWFLDALGPAGILGFVREAADRRASVSTCIGYADASGAKTFVGTIHGSLSTELRGSNGFGYDPIFIPEGEAQTYAEMTAEKRNANSMRTIALQKLKAHLEGIA